MSHVIVTNAGKINNLQALLLACDCIKGPDQLSALVLQLPPGHVIGVDGKVYDAAGVLQLKGAMGYRTWAADHGGLEGDWPVPAGMRANDVGRNAVAVVKLANGAAKQHPRAYEVGVIPQVDPKTQELTYGLGHDFFNRGYGLEDYTGPTELYDDKVKTANGNLLMHYQLMCLRLAAENAGHSCDFEQQADGSYKVYTDREAVGVQA